MIIKSLEIANFRKFRDPLRIDGFTDGLNIIVEPNETGKSTLLEALRAAFFIRHSANTELVRSYIPNGDAVAPMVSVGFSISNETWRLDKRFAKSPYVRLEGPSGRRESDAAEEELQRLLGFERGNNRGSDTETRGPLGLLWCEQAKALVVESPNRIVRDSVRSVLEAEVGVVTGGQRFDAIRARVEAAYGALRTGTGRSRGLLQEAEQGLAAASAALQVAEASYREHENTLDALEAARTRLRIVERDLNDPDIAAERDRLLEEQRLADTAALRVAGAKAEHGEADGRVAAAQAALRQLDEALERVAAGEDRIGAVRTALETAEADADGAALAEKEQRDALNSAVEGREAAEASADAAQNRAQAFAAAAGAQRARDTQTALSDLEERERTLAEQARSVVDGDALDELVRLEREEVAAQARFDAGVVKVDIALAAGATLRVDGAPLDVASLDILRLTRIELGDAGSITVRPPQGTGRSIEADLATVRDALAAARRTLGVGSSAEAIARNERAGNAASELMGVRDRIATACPGDPAVGLAPGRSALQAFVASLSSDQPAMDKPTDDLSALTSALAEARVAEATARGRHDAARDALVNAEAKRTNAARDVTDAEASQRAAQATRDAALTLGDRDTHEATLTRLLQERAGKQAALEQAQGDAGAFDLTAIKRRIGNIDRAGQQAATERLDLSSRIASMEATVERSGTLGPAGLLAQAQEHEAGARAAHDRLVREANVLGLLRDTMAHAATEASRAFLAPVTKRAVRYVQRLMPGAELSFDDELGLSVVTRDGCDEGCGTLSRGTQEQLAILTRLAFADLLLEQQAPISLILDDPLVYSDDARLEVMTEMLQEAAQRMQVILLTCRSKTFRHVEGHRITLANYL